MYKSMTERQSNEYLSFIDGLLNAYNNRGHSSIGFATPTQAMLVANFDYVAYYHTKRYRKAALHRKRPRLSVGDIVRLKTLGKQQHVFQVSQSLTQSILAINISSPNP